MAQLLRNEINVVRDFSMENFWFFVQSLLDPKFYDAIFHRGLCNFFQTSKKDKLIVLPRTFLKTTITSLYALWRTTKDPSLRVLITSNTSPNAEKTVRSIRSIVENNKLYQLLYPDRIPHFSRVRWSDRCACLQRPEDFPEGTFEAVGVGANIIRRHYNMIIEDDTVAPKKDELTGEEAMPSRDDIEKAVGFHKLTIPLLINFEEDERIVVGTRWASYDLINHVMTNEKFDNFNQPAINKEGKPLYKRFSLDTLDSIRMGMGTHMFHSLYLNQPLAKEFMSFNPDWIRYFTDLPEGEEGAGTISIDPADPPTGKKTQNSCAIVGAFHTKSGMYVERYKKGHYTEQQIIKEAFAMADLLGYIKIRIEVDRYANLQYAMKDEMERLGKHYIIDAVKTRGRKKEARIMGLAPLFEAGVVWIKRGMRELEQELFEFPYGATDDLIDALAWQLPSHRTIRYIKKAKPKMKKRYNEFSFDQIMRSTNPRKMRYPFQKQLGLSVMH